MNELPRFGLGCAALPFGATAAEHDAACNFMLAIRAGFTTTAPNNYCAQISDTLLRVEKGKKTVDFY